MVALRLMLEFGNASHKSQAIREIQNTAELEEDEDVVEMSNEEEEQDGDSDDSNESK
jgi:hypothetical protein